MRTVDLIQRKRDGDELRPEEIDYLVDGYTRGQIPEYQVWELVAYVRSLSGQLPSDVAPSRSDEMPVAKAEQARKKEHAPDEYQQKIKRGSNP